VTTSDWIDLLVAVGTLALAAAAFWQIVADSSSRPSLTLVEDAERIDTAVEMMYFPWVRLRVRNARGKRTAHGTRALVKSFRPAIHAGEPTSLAGAELGWPSTELAPGAGAVIFGGQDRPLDFGTLGIGRPDAASAGAKMGGMLDLPDNAQWWFRFTLARELLIERAFLPPIPGGYIAEIVVGADEGNAHVFEVAFNWNALAPTPDTALDSLTVQVNRTAAANGARTDSRLLRLLNRVRP
jgi:hypothetical protein